MLAVLGVADTDLLFSALDAIGARDARAALLGAARLVDTGRDPTVFVKDLEAHARDLMVVQALGELPAELRLTPDRDARLVDQASRSGAARSRGCSTCSPPRWRRAATAPTRARSSSSRS